MDRDVAARLREHSSRLLAEALREGVSSEDAQLKLRRRDEIESHLLAMEALVETGANRASVARILVRLSERLDERQPV